MLRIWGRISSINVRKVVLAAQLMQIPFERIDAGAAFGIVKDEPYKRLNPNSLVPMIEDDGFALWESNVIVRYLCAKHASGTLYPTGLKARFDAERWMDWQQTTLNPAGREAFVQLIRVAEAKRDGAAVERSITATEPLLDMLDNHLAGRRYMGGDVLTMADVPVACEIHRWYGLPLAHGSRPNLDAWYASLRALPAARGVLDLELS
jgi:glutathione S-transferase